MTFFLSLLYSLWCVDRLNYVYLHSNAPKNFFSFFVLFTPLWCVWLIICGGQYGVGTDYFTYYQIFEDVDVDFYYIKGEWLFSVIVEMFRGAGMPPQGLFFIFYFINFFFLLKIVYKINDQPSFIFILLYICLSNVFNNQLNGLRQYCAVYIVTYAMLNFYDNKSYIKYVLSILMAGGLHFSAYMMLPFVLILRFEKLGKGISFTLLLTGLVFSVIGSSSFILNLFSSVIPKHYYDAYIGGELDTAVGFERTITKLIFVPLYISAIFSSRTNWKKNDLRFFSIGIIAYSIRLFFMENLMFNRLGYYFLILSILPLYVYIKSFYQSKKRIYSYLLMSVFLAFYFLKTVVLAKGEYLYQSVYFK